MKLFKIQKNFVKLIVILSILLTSSAISEQVDENFVTLIGSVQNFGCHKFKPGESVGSFISRNGGVPATEEMFAAFQDGKLVPGVKIRLHRGKSVILIDIESGASFYNTLPLRSGDVVHVKFDRKVFWFGFPKLITTEPVEAAKE